jgi:hypothetical protein
MSLNKGLVFFFYLAEEDVSQSVDVTMQFSLLLYSFSTFFFFSDNSQLKDI